MVQSVPRVKNLKVRSSTFDVLTYEMEETLVVQRIDYETDPYSFQLSQNMATDCLFTSVFFPILI